MARRVTWTNNSTDYDGTNIYRDTTLDPQNLPAPLATVGPAAQGEMVEYIDPTGSGDQCYAVRDFDSSGDGALSEAYCFEETTDWSQVSVGDEVEGGIYLGVKTYSDGDHHVIAAKQDGEASALSWDQYGINTGATDADHGRNNTDLIVAAGGGAAVDYCVNYSVGSYSDWYLAASNEHTMINPLYSDGHPEFQTNPSDFRWVSTEFTSTKAYSHRFTTAGGFDQNKQLELPVRPFRRVPV